MRLAWLRTMIACTCHPLARHNSGAAARTGAHDTQANLSRTPVNALGDFMFGLIERSMRPKVFAVGGEYPHPGWQVRRRRGIHQIDARQERSAGAWSARAGGFFTVSG